MLEKPIFLVGAERSGTTLLRLMLSHHPQIAWCNEFEYSVDKITNINQFPDIEQYKQWLETHRIFQATNFQIKENLTYPELVNDFLLQKKEQEQKTIIGATVHRHFDRLLSIWKDAKFIHLIRDARDVARSCISMGWAGNVWQGVDRWIESEQLWDNLVVKLDSDRYVEITYENLISQPEKILTELCQFMGVNYDQSMLNYDQNTTYDKPSTEFITQWQNKLSDKETQLIESKVSKLLVKRNYQLSGLPIIKVNNFEQKKLSIQDWYYRANFRLKRYGFWLFTADFISRRLKLNQWQKNIKLKLNEIDAMYLK